MTEIAINTESLTKFYKLYKGPKERMLEALNPLRKIYHTKFYALRNINIQVSQGTVMGILGKNGSGKSTLLKLIAGVLVPSSGKVSVNGNVLALLELGGGFNPEFTGKQNIFFYASLLNLPKKYIEKKLEEIIEFAELGEFINQPLKTYSSGMRSRLAFAIAAHVNPDILILDEVLAVGDIRFQRKCFTVIEEIKNNGCTILFVSHSLAAISTLCDKALIIEKGCVFAIGDTREIVNKYSAMMFEGENRSNSRNRIKEIKEDQSAKTEKSTLSGKETRSGSGRAKVRDFCVLDELGKEVYCLYSGKKYTFSMTVHFNDSAAKPVFGMLIKTVKGIAVFGTNTHHAGTKIKSYEEGANETVTFEVYMNLASGKYFVSYTVGDFEEMYDARLDSQLIEVISTSPIFPNSLVDLHPIIKLQDDAS